MDVVRWDHNLETGFAEVDSQHMHLVNLTNEFGVLLTRDQMNSIAVEKLYAELVAYTEYHFEEEEKLMTTSAVDSQHFNLHEKEHQGFLEDVSLLHSEILAGSNNAKNLFEFLLNWLIYHILGSDMCMARQLKAIRQGVSSAEAYANETQQADQAKGLLLSSLNNLFSQMTFRNRQLRELNHNLEEKVMQRTQALTEANSRLKELAATDALTGLSNRRHAMETLEALWLKSTAEEQPLACLLVDADGFKEINDSFGHDTGDQVLCELAKHLSYAVRTDDLVCRLGGDEFLIICPNTGREGLQKIATQVHSRINELKVPVVGGCWSGSISVGAAARNAKMRSPEELIKLADRGVYAAKNAGKNCVKMVD
jgi:hemerythrin